MGPDIKIVKVDYEDYMETYMQGDVPRLLLQIDFETKNIIPKDRGTDRAFFNMLDLPITALIGWRIVLEKAIKLKEKEDDVS